MLRVSTLAQQNCDIFQISRNGVKFACVAGYSACSLQQKTRQRKTQPMGRGRTWRKRRLRMRRIVPARSDPQTCHRFESMLAWMRQNGWSPTSPLQLAVFRQTGRGMMATSTIEPNHLLVAIPAALIITRDVALQNLDCNLDSSSYWTTLELLSLFLLQEKMKDNSFYSTYIQLLPPSFSCGSLCSDEELTCLPGFVCSEISVLRQRFEALVQKCQQTGLHITARDISWAWHCVSTRIVYYENKDSKSREDNCALVPYLDMFNHNPSAKIKASFIEKSQCYEITTYDGYTKYDEVFIQYGQHDNLRLFLDYGFVIPRNPHHNYSFELEDLSALVTNVHPLKLSAIKKLGLQGNLYCSNEGPSWSLIIACGILAGIYDNHIDTSMLFDQDWQSVPKSVKTLIDKLVRTHVKDLSQKLQAIDQQCRCSANYETMSLLVQDTIRVLESSLK